MQDTNVLVTFCSRLGSTERSALAAALGAVQARGFIRLRWLREAVDDATVDGVPGWRENRDRMEREYIAPRAIDFEWADALIVALPEDAALGSAEVRPYFELLNSVRSAGKLHATAVGVVIAGPADAACAELGFEMVPRDAASAGNAVDRARLQGQRVTEAARRRKRQ
jgi:hypothetical protein